MLLNFFPQISDTNLLDMKYSLSSQIHLQVNDDMNSVDLIYIYQNLKKELIDKQTKQAMNNSINKANRGIRR